MLLAAFFDNVVNYFKDNPAYLIIAAVALVLLIVIIVAIIVACVKKSKRKKAEEAPAQRGEAVNAKPALQPSEDAVNELPAATVQETPAAEAAPAQAEPVQAEPEPVAAAPAQQAEPAAPAAAEGPAEEAPAPAAAEEPAKTARKKPAAKAEDEEERKKIYSGKWLIFKRGEEDGGSYYFELRASNGEKLLGSIDYASLQGAKAGIRTYKNNIAKDNFTIAQSKTGLYFFKLLSGSKQMLCTGETYSSRSSCESAVESVKRFADTAVVSVVSENEED